jgi:PST family polysaccharide transporter
MGQRWELVQNVLASYGFYVTGYLLSLILLPYLVRVLGPTQWGLLAFVQAFCGYLILIQEYGFAFSATRFVASRRASRYELAHILASVTGAKLLLSLVCIALAALVGVCVPTFRAHPRLFWWGVLWSLLQGANLNWFYQGLERMRIAATVDMSIKGVATLLIMTIVRTPEDAWKVFLLNAVACTLSLTALFTLCYRTLPFALPSRSGVANTLREGLSTFIPRNSLLLSSMGGVFILGIFRAPDVVGHYAAAERIARTLFGILGPLTDALYSRITRIIKSTPAAFGRAFRISYISMSFCGLLIGVTVFLTAPHIVRIVLGNKFGAAVAILRVLAFIAPALALSNTVGVHWMLAMGLYRSFNWLTLLSVVANCCLALLLAPIYAGLGVACGLLTSQILLGVGAYVVMQVESRDARSTFACAPQSCAQPVCATADSGHSVDI